MARGKSNTKQCSILKKDLDAEASADNKGQTEVSQTEDSTGEGTSNYDDSFDSNYDEEIPMKKQGSGKVYDITPAKRGSRKSNLQPKLPRKNQNIFIRRRVMTTLTKRSNPKVKGKMQATISLILTILLTTETIIPLETTKKK